MRVCILLPVYNDWACLPRLLAEIDAVLADDLTAAVVVLNDGGEPAPKDAPFLTRPYARISEIQRLELVRNVGNQVAISIGLSYIRDRVVCDAVVVMDSDGQDQPAHIRELVQAHRRNPGHLVAAQRHGRAEGPLFRACYQLYRFAFLALTGMRIGFGNFSLIPRRHVDRLCGMTELPFHFAASLIKSRLPVERVPCYRGARYDGVTSQNLVGLVIHAINAVSVFSDIALIRVSLAAGAVIVAGLAASLLIAVIRLVTDVWIMGYATIAIGIVMLAMGQALVLSLVGIFVRAQRPISLVGDPEQYRVSIARIETMAQHRAVRAVP